MTEPLTTGQATTSALSEVRARRWTAVAASLVVPAFAWSYWPTLAQLKDAWDHVPDYSHGYLVAPLAGYFLWARRGTCPPACAGWNLGGLALLIFSLAVRAAGALWNLGGLQGFSIVLWVGGTIWLLAGYARFRWSLAAVLFLAFMVPWPFSAERLLSVPLQRTATEMSCWLLQLIGQPAVAEGNVIVIGDTPLLVAEACSGLRIFVSVLALACAYLILSRKRWWTRLGLLAGVLPVALVANSARIVVTGLLHAYATHDAAKRFSHDLAGWLMLPLAALLMAGLVWYFERLFVEVRAVSTTELLAGNPRVTR